MAELGIYSGLFLVAFLAATILPAQSEVGLAGLVMSDSHSVVLLVAVASAGNILGAVVNWGLGRGIERFAGRRWFPITPNRLERAAGWYRRYGRWSLLFSWAPFIGRSEEHTSELQSIMRNSYAVLCLKKKKNKPSTNNRSRYADTT